MYSSNTFHDQIPAGLASMLSKLLSHTVYSDLLRKRSVFVGIMMEFELLAVSLNDGADPQLDGA